MTAKPPPDPLRRFRFTRDQYHDLGRLGYFDGKRVELIYGEIIEISPINWHHRIGTGRSVDALEAAFGAGFFVDAQQPFPVPGGKPGSEPQPDVQVILGARSDYTDHPAVAALLVEVSDSTLSYDLTTKAELYATAGVTEYWVLDLNGRELHVFRDPQPYPLPPDLAATAYRTHGVLSAADSVSPLAAPHSSIRVSDLLP